MPQRLTGPRSQMRAGLRISPSIQWVCGAPAFGLVVGFEKCDDRGHSTYSSEADQVKCTPIHAIQGSDLRSPLAGTEVRARRNQLLNLSNSGRLPLRDARKGCSSNVLYGEPILQPIDRKS